MRIDKRRDERVAYLYVKGDIDLPEADLLREAGRAALSPDCSILRIDLSGVTFLNSAGLAALIAIRNDALPAHVLVLENLPPGVRRIFEISGLDAVFNIQ